MRGIDPSPASNTQLSPPKSNTVQELPLNLEGLEPPVPMKVSLNSGKAWADVLLENLENLEKDAGVPAAAPVRTRASEERTSKLYK